MTSRRRLTLRSLSFGVRRRTNSAEGPKNKQKVRPNTYLAPKTQLHGFTRQVMPSSVFSPQELNICGSVHHA